MVGIIIKSEDPSKMAAELNNCPKGSAAASKGVTGGTINKATAGLAQPKSPSMILNEARSSTLTSWSTSLLTPFLHSFPKVSMRHNMPVQWSLESQPTIGRLASGSYQYKVSLGSTYEAVGTGANKKVAKQNAAANLIQGLPDELKEPKHKRGKKRSTELAGASTSGATSTPPPAKKPTPAAAASIGPVAPSNLVNKSNNSQPQPVHKVIQNSNPISALYEYTKKGNDITVLSTLILLCIVTHVKSALCLLLQSRYLIPCSTAWAKTSWTRGRRVTKRSRRSNIP